MPVKTLFQTVKRQLVGITVLLLLVIAGVLLFADVQEVGGILTRFNWRFLPLVLALTLLDDVLRFVKWNYFLRTIEIELSVKDSARVFFSGLAMAITPGKVGEVLKSYLLKQRTGAPMSRTLPVVVMERLTDLIAVTILAAVGAIVFRYGVTVVVAVGVLLFFLIAVVQSRKVSLRIIGLINTVPFMTRYSSAIRSFYMSSYDLLRLHRLLLAIGISVVAWGSECLGLYVIYLGLGDAQSFLFSSFVFSFSSIAGAVSALPGGLGVTEASMTAIMVGFGMKRGIAASAMLLIRFCTLWFGFFTGTIVLIWNRKAFQLGKSTGVPCRE